MESVLDMLRPLHFVFLFAAFTFLAFAVTAENEGVPPNVQSEVESPDANANDLEADATYWGYGRPGRYYGGWGGYGRGYGRGYGWGGWRGGYYGGWGGRGYYGGRGWNNGWGGYWGY